MGEQFLSKKIEYLAKAIKIKNIKIFTERILSMMVDYDISLREALIWDMEGFDSYNYKIDSHVQHYLVVNGIVDIEDRLFYIKIIKGLVPDVGLSKNKESEKDDSPRN